jgi:hypothetical protein
MRRGRRSSTAPISPPGMNPIRKERFYGLSRGAIANKHDANRLSFIANQSMKIQSRRVMVIYETSSSYVSSIRCSTMKSTTTWPFIDVKDS